MTGAGYGAPAGVYSPKQPYGAPAPVAVLEEQTDSGFKDLEKSKPRKNKVSLRSYFPENWLFDFVNFSETVGTRLR
jgi:hypothetical protein